MRFALIILTASLVFACSKTNIVTLPDTTNYFPLAVGTTVVYEVDSIIYSPLYAGGKDTFLYDYKETIIRTDNDLEGNMTYIVERVERERGTLAWRNPVIGQRVLKQNRAEEVFDNLRFIPLTFPMIEGNAWNGNQYIPNNDTFAFYDGWSYTISAIDVSESINDFNFDSVAIVDHIFDEALLGYRYSQAKYAKGIGMVEWNQSNLSLVTNNPDDFNKPWPDRASNGYIVHWRIKDF